MLDLNQATVSGCTVAVVSPQLGPFDAQRNLSPYASGGGGGVFLYGSNLTVRGGTQARTQFTHSHTHPSILQESLHTAFK